MNEVNVIPTADGSHTLMNTTLQETYHSVHGALQESSYVFLEQGLANWRLRNPTGEIRILEVGFGTGLNTLLTLLYANKNKYSVYYVSWEMHPLEPAIVQQLNYGELTGAGDFFEQIHEAAWDKAIPITPFFALFKHFGDFVHDSLPKTSFDIIYYDAFAPSKQPEMWTVDILKKATTMLNPGGVWVSYCAKGQVKRDLASLGLAVETLPGPPGKKEMTRASRLRS